MAWILSEARTIWSSSRARLKNGKLVRVSIAKIPQANWTLIRVVTPGTVDRIDRNLDQRNRQDIEQDIFMERELFTW